MHGSLCNGFGQFRIVVNNRTCADIVYIDVDSVKPIFNINSLCFHNWNDFGLTGICVVFCIWHLVQDVNESKCSGTIQIS